MGSEAPTTMTCDFSVVWEAVNNDHGQDPSATLAAFASGERVAKSLLQPLTGYA
jgi:hypothetical protein